MTFVTLTAHAAAIDEPSEQVRQRLEQLTAGDLGQISGVRFFSPTTLQRFYQNRGFTLAWNSANAAALIEMVNGAASQGLDPDDYLSPQLAELPRLDDLTDAERVDADLILSESFLRFAYHCRFGKVDPNSIETAWNYSRSASQEGALAALERILGADDFADQFAREMGHGPVYAALQEVLVRYRQYADSGGWQVVTPGPTLRVGDTDARIAALRQRLIAEGYDAEATGVAATRFDAPLAIAVTAFQRNHGLQEDGIVGKATVAELNVSASTRVEQIRINLERLRWVMGNAATAFVAVNIAGFRVYYVDNAAVQWSARAVVGRPYRATPVFRAEMKYLVFNPDWTVPPTILRQDVLPAQRRDPDYLAKNQMEVIDAKGQPIDPATIDWSQYPASAFPYLIRQRPGPTNSLGRIKFIFPNPEFVFLHDTPSKNLFERADRTFSSGCIRVEHPLELAEILLRNKPGWSRAHIDAVVASEVTKTVFLDKPVPVLLLYLTAIAFDGGHNFAFYRDVYARDAKVHAALNRDFVYVPPRGLASAGG